MHAVRSGLRRQAAGKCGARAGAQAVGAPCGCASVRPTVGGDGTFRGAGPICRASRARDPDADVRERSEASATRRAGARTAIDADVRRRNRAAPARRALRPRVWRLRGGRPGAESLDADVRRKPSARAARFARVLDAAIRWTKLFSGAACFAWARHPDVRGHGACPARGEPPRDADVRSRHERFSTCSDQPAVRAAPIGSRPPVHPALRRPRRAARPRSPARGRTQVHPDVRSGDRPSRKQPRFGVALRRPSRRACVVRGDCSALRG
jgi:hypothetical protein